MMYYYKLRTLLNIELLPPQINMIAATNIRSLFLGSNCPTRHMGTAKNIKTPAQIKKGAELVMTSEKAMIETVQLFYN